MDGVLIVEDDADAREALEELLSLEGYEVQGAADGAEALALLERQGPPELLLVDEYTPRMSGRELLAVIARRPELAQMAAVVASGSRSGLTGSAGRLDKPFRAADVLDLVQRHCQGVRLVFGHRFPNAASGKGLGAEPVGGQ